jgi:hypothetical protein
MRRSSQPGNVGPAEMSIAGCLDDIRSLYHPEKEIVPALEQ